MNLNFIYYSLKHPEIVPVYYIGDYNGNNWCNKNCSDQEIFSFSLFRERKSPFKIFHRSSKYFAYVCNPNEILTPTNPKRR